MVTKTDWFVIIVSNVLRMFPVGNLFISFRTKEFDSRASMWLEKNCAERNEIAMLRIGLIIAGIVKQLCKTIERFIAIRAWNHARSLRFFFRLSFWIRTPSGSVHNKVLTYVSNVVNSSVYVSMCSCTVNGQHDTMFKYMINRAIVPSSGIDIEM